MLEFIKISYSIKNINDLKVEFINIKHLKPEKIKGYQYIPLLYDNIFICRHKNMEKTSVLLTIMKNNINKNTKVIVFCNTCYSDKNLIEITKWLKSKNQPYIIYDSIFNDDKTLNLKL